MEDLNNTDIDDLKDKLEAAVEAAVDDETYRKVKRMSYQSHNADEIIRSIGLQSRTPVSARSSTIISGAATPYTTKHKNDQHSNDIAALDKLLTSLLGLRESRRGRSLRSNLGTPRTSRMPAFEELNRNRRSESWPERIFENTIVRNVLHELRSNGRNSPAEEPFLTPR